MKVINRGVKRPKGLVKLQRYNKESKEFELWINPDFETNEIHWRENYARLGNTKDKELYSWVEKHLGQGYSVKAFIKNEQITLYNEYAVDRCEVKDGKVFIYFK